MEYNSRMEAGIAKSCLGSLLRAERDVCKWARLFSINRKRLQRCDMQAFVDSIMVKGSVLECVPQVKHGRVCFVIRISREYLAKCSKAAGVREAWSQFTFRLGDLGNEVPFGGMGSTVGRLRPMYADACRAYDALR